MSLEIRDNGMADLVRTMSELADLRIVVGYPEGGGEHPTAGMSFAELGAIHEYGTMTIHARSYLRSTFVEKKRQIVASQEKGIRAVVSGRMTPLDAKIATAKLTAKLVKYKMLQALKWAHPLADSTVKAKGHNVPLDETHALIDALGWAVYRGDTRLAGGKA